MNSIFNFMFTEKYSALSVSLNLDIPLLSPKTTDKMSQDLTVSGKTLEMDQN